MIRIYRIEEVTTNPAKIMKRSSQRVKDTAVHLDTGASGKDCFKDSAVISCLKEADTPDRVPRLSAIVEK